MTTNERNPVNTMTDNELLDRFWDDESHSSPFSTVAGSDCDEYCECCDSPIVADPRTADGFRCNCDDPANSVEAAA